MNKNIIRVSLIFPIILMAVTAHAQGEDVNSYESLKNAIDEGLKKSESAIDLSGDIQFGANDKLFDLKGTDGTKTSVKIDGKSHGLKGYNPENGGKVFSWNDAFIIGSNTTLTLKNITISGFKGSSGAANSAAIMNNGNLILLTQENENITFENNNGGERRGTKAGDIYNAPHATILINGEAGTVSFGTGIYGDGTITHDGENTVELGGNNDQFKGKFENKKGKVTVKKGANLFGGQNIFESGSSLTYLSSSAVTGHLTLNGGVDVTVGDDSSETETGNGANLVLKSSNTNLTGNESINYTVKKGATLDFDGFNSLTFSTQIHGTGKLDFKNDTVTINGTNSGGFENEMGFASTNSTIKLSNFTNDDKTLKSIASGTNSNLDLTLDSYTGNISDTLTVDGSSIKHLTFSGSNNNLNGKLTVEQGGTVDNNASTTLGGALQNGGTFNNNGALTLDGKENKNANTGVFTNNSSVTGESAIFENSGTFTNTNGTVKLKELINESTFTGGSVTVDKLDNTGTISNVTSLIATGAVTNGESEDESSVSISGDTLTFGSVVNNAGTITASGTLTVNGSEKPNVKNDGTITAKDISVNGDVENSGTITASGALTVGGKLTNNGDKGNITFAGGSLQDIDNSGTITNSGDLTLGGTITGNGSLLTNSGNITLNGNASGYTGTYTQTAGSLTVSGGAKIFGGEKTINGGTVSITSDSLDYTNLKLGSNVTFEHKSTSSSHNKINQAAIQFTGTGATATFSGSGHYDLNSDVKGAGNTMTFSNTKLYLAGDKGTDEDTQDINDVKYDYSGFADITLNQSSTLDLHGSAATIAEYNLSKFTFGEGSKLDFDVRTAKGDGADAYYLESDTVKFGDGSTGTLHVGNIYIDSTDDETEGGKKYETQKDVLSGGDVKFEQTTLTVASDDFLYDVTVDEHTVSIEKKEGIGTDTLQQMNKSGETKSANRQFSHNNNRVKDNETGETAGDYVVNEDLGNTGNGDFSVFGANKDEGDDITDAIDAQNHSLFNIGEDNETNLHVENLEIKNASSNSRGGSVFSNQSAGSSAHFNDTIIENNKGTGKGGAIYNNGGSVTTDEKDGSITGFAGVFIGDTIFTGNSATENKGGTDGDGKGGAIYNDSQGNMYLESVTVNAGSDEAKNDIFNSGKMYTGGNNDFKSTFENSESGDASFGGNNNFADLDNTGKVTFRGEADTTQNITDLNNSGSGNIEFGAGVNNVDKFTNNAKATVSGGTNEFKDVDNSKTLTFAAGNTTIDDLESKTGSDIDVEKDSSLTLKTVTGSAGDITNSGGYVELSGDASGYTGTFHQGAQGAEMGMNLLSAESGDGVNAMPSDEPTDASGNMPVTVVNNKFFGGESTITGGALVWKTMEGASGTLTVSGADTILQIGDGENAAELDLASGSSVESQVNILDGSKIDVKGGNLTFKDGSHWLGTVAVESSGTLTVDYDDSVKTRSGGSAKQLIQGLGSVLTAENGTVDVKKGTLYVGSGSTIGDGATTKIEAGGTLLIEGGSVSLNTGDTASGLTILNGGTLDYGNGVTATDNNAKLQAYNGNLNIKNSGKLTLSSENSFVDGGVNLNIEDGASVDLTVGELQIDESDTWTGTITLDGGTLDYNTQSSGDLVANSGNLNLLSGSNLTVDEGSDIKNAVAVNIENGATVSLSDKAKFEIDSDDTWNGVIKNDGGDLTVSGVDNTNGFGGDFQQEKESSTTNFTKGANIVISGDDTSVTNGAITIDNSAVKFAQGTNITLKSLKLSSGSTFSTLNGVAQTIDIDTLTVSGNNNVDLDIDVMGNTGDRFVSKNLTAESAGTIHIRNFDFVGDAPNRKNLRVQLFDVTNGNGDGNKVNFTVSDNTVMSVIGEYGLTYDKEGYFNVTLNRINPQILRGQVSTLAAFNNQLTVDEIVLNHTDLRLETPSGKMPATRMSKQGNVWAQAYANTGKLKLSNGIEPDNTTYGVVAGLDLPRYKLANRWSNMTSLYVAYSGASQEFNDVELSQNGAQIGLMETFDYNDFATSVMLFGGMYTNTMDVASGSEDFTNWLAGAAARMSYDWHAMRNLIVQPNATITYTAIGKQDWKTSVGDIDVLTDRFNGLSVAPGVTVEYTPVNYNLFASVNYVYHIMDELGGRAGIDVDLPDVGMDSGYAIARVGAVQGWTDRLNTNVQLVGRWGSRTDFGLQIGAQWKF